MQGFRVIGDGHSIWNWPTIPPSKVARLNLLHDAANIWLSILHKQAVINQMRPSALEGGAKVMYAVSQQGAHSDRFKNWPPIYDILEAFHNLFLAWPLHNFIQATLWPIKKYIPSHICTVMSMTRNVCTWCGKVCFLCFLTSWRKVLLVLDAGGRFNML